jgi:hypothetical protein
MAEQAEGGNIFVYLGGEQEVPDDVTHVRIDRSVKIIRRQAFYRRRCLVSLDFHDGVEKIEERAFYGCICLRRMKLPGVKEVGDAAFRHCRTLSDVTFGDKLETMDKNAFDSCTSLRNIKIPTVRIIERSAFGSCQQLTDMEFGVKLERIEEEAFFNCESLQRIAIPLKNNLFHLATIHRRCTQFDNCDNLTTVDLVGDEGIRKTIASFLLDRWRNEILQEIDRINQLLPNTPHSEKTDAIRLWIRSVINRMGHYKTEHNRLVKEATTLLELALWKAKLDEKEEEEDPKLDEKDEDNSNLKDQAKNAKIDVESMRKERRIKSGADIVIKNVLPFLQLG